MSLLDQVPLITPWYGSTGTRTAPELAVSGQFFTDAGKPWTGIASSEFSLPKRFLVGEDIRPILDERAEIGFNELRVWILNRSVVGAVYPGGIHPSQHSNFYDRLHELWILLGSYGFAVEVTAFTQAGEIMPNVADQQSHWVKTIQCIAGLKHVRAELVNEYNHPVAKNAPDQSLWSMRPNGVISSSGSATADAAPPVPVWHYVCYHSNGLDQWQRKVGHNTMEYANEYRMPGAANENTRYPDQDSSELHAYDAAAGAALLCASACFHSEQGKRSTLFSESVKINETLTFPPVTRFAQAWAKGAQSVPLEFQRGIYHHRTDLEGGNVIRAYDRQLQDGRTHVVLIHE